MRGRKGWTMGLVALALAAAAGPVQAQTTFGQPVVQIVAGGAAGGVFDVAVRIVSDRLGRELGRTIVIDNRPGAAGAVALSYVKNAKPDGLTVAVVNVGAAANELILKDRGYNLLADFEPVGIYAYPTNVLIVNPAIPGDSVAAFVSALKARGAATNFASGGVGSPAHLASEVFKARTGLPLTHVPYRGAPPAVLAVVTGETDFMFATASAALPQVTAGKVRALAVTTAERLPQLANVPTMAQAGLADFNVSDWIGFLLPKATPGEIRDRLHAGLAAAFAEPEARERLRNATLIPAAPALGPAETGAFLRAEVDKWAKVVSEAKISP